MTSIALRQELRDWRAQLSLREQQLVAEQAAQHVINSDLFLYSEHIACYLPFMGELDTSPIINAIFKLNKRCYLPVMDVARPGHMRFLEYRKGDVLIKNHIGILEPRASAREMQPWALDVVITPLVAFDKAGNRLGSGCGFYDRLFAGINDWACKPVLCGYAYQQQGVEKLDAQPWDVPMDVVVTDKIF
jgi:5-formyltetrahydrofolate cyclo-ligase